MSVNTIQTGYPQECAELVADLVKERPRASWLSFLRKYGSGPKEKGAGTQKSEQQAGPPGDGWAELLDRIALLDSEVLTDRSCDEFVRWGPRVARYSFQAARLVSFESDESTDKPEGVPIEGVTQ